ncbi:MAG: hypothetical protein OEM02_03575 [Desulfobulbaceae bacterium]|nr:hypothetical protein [Desulfobulbaceae bacterium]
MTSIDSPLGAELVKEALLSPWIWASFVAGGVLLLSYLLAIRTMDLTLSYAIVTSAALLTITVISSFVFGEALTAMKITGVVLIIFGITFITR